MSGTTRTFLAIELPETHKNLLRQLEDRLAPEAGSFRWVAPELCHLTLAFLGDVPDADLDRIGQAAGAAAATVPPFQLMLDGLGMFPSPGRARVVWVGAAGADVGVLKQLQRSLLAALRAIGRPPAHDRFSPHVTIARIKPDRRLPPNLTALLERHQGWSAGAFAVSEVVTFASVLAPSGPTYTALARAPLGGGKPAPTP
jgi:2'-5' RNA ligase